MELYLFCQELKKITVCVSLLDLSIFHISRSNENDSIESYNFPKLILPNPSHRCMPYTRLQVNLVEEFTLNPHCYISTGSPFTLRYLIEMLNGSLNIRNQGASVKVFLQRVKLLAIDCFNTTLVSQAAALFVLNRWPIVCSFVELSSKFSITYRN